MTENTAMAPTAAPAVIMIFSGILTGIMAFSGEQAMFTISLVATVACAGLVAASRIMDDRIKLKYR